MAQGLSEAAFVAQPGQSRSPPSFLTVPLEIRLEIYRHLLLPYRRHDRYLTKSTIKPRNVYWLDPVYPAILRTARKIYEEASAILYEENTFTFDCEASSWGRRRYWCTDQIPRASLKRCQHMAIEFCQLDSYLHTNGILSIIKDLRELDCNLKTVLLEFLFVNAHGFPVHGGRTGDRIARRFEIVAAIRSLSVSQQIVIRVITDRAAEGQEFQILTDSVVADLGWKMEKTFRSHRKTIVGTIIDDEESSLPSEQDVYTAASNNNRYVNPDPGEAISEYTWIWTLTPVCEQGTL